MSEKWSLAWSPLIKLLGENLISVPNSPGVYRLSYLANDEKIYVFYVGKTDNLQQRLQAHLSKHDDDICIGRMISNAACYFRYAIVNSEAIRNGAERALYIYYKPQCNSQEPYGPDIEINFD
jgi:excinuclease UvrABC nuclease subunit